MDTPPVTLTPVMTSDPVQQSHEGSPGMTGSLPRQLEGVKAAQVLQQFRHRWNTNEEIASILLAFSQHATWLQRAVFVRPPSGRQLLYNRNHVRYRRDGYCWKKRKDGKTIREDHMKLKVQGLECIYGSYVHSAILPTFHRRCYWLLQNPDIVLVHYLNVPYPSNAKLSIPVLSIAMEKKEWTKEELTQQLRPMFSGSEGENLSALDDSVQTLVQRLMDNQGHFKSDNGGGVPGGLKPPRFTPVPIQPDPHPPREGGYDPVTSTLKSETFPAVIDNKQNTAVNFAQSVILNIGNLPNGQQVMLLTGHAGQTNRSQLSLLSTHSSVGHNVPNINPCLSSQPVVSTVPLTSRLSAGSYSVPMTSGHFQPHGPSGACLERSASLCDPQNSFDGAGMQRSHSEEGHIHLQHGKRHFHQFGRNVGFVQSVANVSPQPTTIQGMTFSNSFNHCQESIVNSQSSNTITMETNSHNLSSEQNADTSLYQSVYSQHSENENSIVNSLLDELNSELMASESNSTNECKKNSFGHLGDSFESLQASLSTMPNGELNLDQLDLIDMPDLENMCNDISNEIRSTNIPECNTSGANLTNCTQQNLQNQSAEGDGRGQSTVQADAFSFCEEQAKNSGTQNVSRRSSSPHLPGNCHSCNCHVSRSCQGQGLSDCQGQIKAEVGGAHTTKSPITIATITDYSPEWSYTEGQTKLLVTGPWHANTGRYSVLMDGKVLATTLVQPGVLRCFVPGHRKGPVSLEVSCDGSVISNNATFQYHEKPRQNQSTSTHQGDWFSVEDPKLQEQLVYKLEKIEVSLSKVPDFPSIQQSLSNAKCQYEADTAMCRHIESLSTRLWTNNDLARESSSFMGLSLLHIVAALGFHRCIKTLISWRNENSSWILEYEADANSLDLNSCTPLMWASARGHTEAAISLFTWNKGPLLSSNKEGNLPLMVARQHGHHSLADQLEQLYMSCDKPHDLTSSSSMSHDIHSGSLPTCLYSMPSNSFDNSHFSTEMCSATPSVSTVSSTPNMNYFSTELPNSTSTQVSKDISPSPNDPSLTNQTTDSVSVLNELHISIPHEDQDLSNVCKLNLHGKREHSSIQKTDQDLKNKSPYTSTCKCSNSASSIKTRAEKRHHLQKRFSVDVISNQTLEPVHFSPSTAFQRPVREANSEPHLAGNMEHMLCRTNPMLSAGREIGSPEMLVQLEHCERHGHHCNGQSDPSSQITMDTDNQSEGSNNSDIDVERVSSDDEDIRKRILAQGEDNPQPQMVHLAKQIIAAMPERIKSSPSRGDDIQVEEFQRERSSSYSSVHSSSPLAPSSYGEALSSYGEDSGISTPMHDSLAFDEYRYADVYSDLGTPASSLSPDSTCLHSPYSPYSFLLDSPPPTAAEFVEYFNAPATFMEKDFSQLTLSDREQRKLYEAAKVIQSAYRQYRDKQCKQQAKEREAAVLIQSYYRRYKQYAYYKKMTQAAVLIQSQFRSYYAQKRFKKSRDAAVVIQNQYRSYKEHERLKKGGNKSVTQRFRSHYQRKPKGAKGSRVVQIVPDTDGSQGDPSTPTEDCPHASDPTVTPGDEEEQAGEAIHDESSQGK
ncbi:calmodulin-binding transcription activator 2-like isoform X2 [Mya arenaria]|uniref:calmodulin-binding transcription activator 2-like isoform X2 n=1 Tax=Mya arenaria TaxID=6604 RepID=UPI0022E7BBD1|nr:calmodulin-binding transcription activator 2-like isoform X2 [Mya arenaria]